MTTSPGTLTSAPDAIVVELAPSPPTPWQRLKRNRLAMISLGFLVALVFVAILAPFVAPYGYNQQETSNKNQGPSSAHWLGTDELGRDTLSRLLYGAGISLLVGVSVEIFVITIGLLVGLTAGFLGGRVDSFLMRVTDVMLAFPDILLAILLLGTIGARSDAEMVLPLFNVMIPPAVVSLGLVILALGVTGWPPLARLVRGQVLSLRKREFVEAARAMGATDRRIVLKHILPNLLSPVLVAVTVDLAGVILAEATLSFLGIGVQRPFPSWGRMINDALEYYRSHPRLIIVPSVLLSMTVLALNFLGDGLRDALDPRRRQ